MTDRPQPVAQATSEVSIREMLYLLDCINCDGKCNLESEKCDYTCQKAINIVAKHDAAIRKDERERVLDKFIDIVATRYCTSRDIEHGDIPRIALDELAEVIESLRNGVIESLRNGDAK